MTDSVAETLICMKNGNATRVREHPMKCVQPKHTSIGKTRAFCTSNLTKAMIITGTAEELTRKVIIVRNEPVDITD